MKLLLDTCTLLWLSLGSSRISANTEALLRSGPDVYVSAASVWEIAIKHARGKLPLPTPLPEFVRTLRSRFEFKTLPIDEESALHVAKLPPLHADPFDRMLVAQAIVHGLTIVTPDPAVTQYPARTLW
ncbi:MAG: type II toxin-antitoxin system VapC family toxin [Vicinamibacterales bacterium]